MNSNELTEDDERVRCDRCRGDGRLLESPAEYITGWVVCWRCKGDGFTIRRAR